MHKNLGYLDNHKSVRSNIDEEIRNVEDFKSQLSSAELALDDLELKLNAVEYKEGDVNSVRASLINSNQNTNP